MALATFATTFFISMAALSRWAEFNESDYVTKSLQIKNKVFASGGYETQYSRTIQIKKESARTKQGLYRLTFNPFAESISSIEARTINPTQTYVVKKKDIEIKSLASAGPGFDTRSQISVAFPNVEVGSKLEIKYYRVNKKPRVPKLFSEHYSLGDGVAYENYKETWDSEVPLYVEIHDPDGFLKVSKSNKDKYVEIELIKPIYRDIIEEKNSISNPKDLVWAAVSTISTWKDFPKKTIQSYESVINSELPKKLQDIYIKALDINDRYEQINSVTSNLAESLRYLGDWRLVRGAYHPHTLKQIVKSGYGDCKDMSVSAGAILKKLGYNVHAVFIDRDVKTVHSPLQLAALRYNHAILWAERDGKEYWIDPTNFTSSAQRIFPDIADREAIILKPTGAVLSRAPAIDAKTEIIDTTLTLNFKNQTEIVGDGRISLLGFASESMTGLSLSKSKSNLDHRLVTWATNIPDLMEWKFDNYDFSSRIVKDFSTNFTFTAGWHPIRTSAGQAYLVESSSIVKALDFPRKDRVGSLHIVRPHESIRKIKFVGENILYNKETQCEGVSKWFSYRRKVTKERDALFLKDEVTLNQTTIPSEDLKTTEFWSEQQKILSCMSSFAVVFK